ncbi:Excisionase [Cupriavidus taiwanensis]|nr:Excisionase [Cupriavidus taiwanensis]SOY81951.1 Excisionase [Cupriavidus taiwanensis]
MIRYLTISKFAAESGYTEKAIRAKIHDGAWPEGVWLKAADGRILIDVKGYEEWVETARVLKKPQKAASKSRSPIGVLSAVNGFVSSPLPLT